MSPSLNKVAHVILIITFIFFSFANTQISCDLSNFRETRNCVETLALCARFSQTSPRVYIKTRKMFSISYISTRKMFYVS